MGTDDAYAMMKGLEKVKKSCYSQIEVCHIKMAELRANIDEEMKDLQKSNTNLVETMENIMQVVSQMKDETELSRQPRMKFKKYQDSDSIISEVDSSSQRKDNSDALPSKCNKRLVVNLKRDNKV